MPIGELSTYAIGITPFDERGALDEAALRLHCRRMVAAGIGFYAGGSSPGEQYSLEPREVARVLEIAVEEMKGKAPVRAMGVEPRRAQQMVEFARIAEASGVDAIQVYSLELGHGNHPTEAELERYFRTVLEATTMPVVLSSHFVVMGFSIPIELISRFASEYDHLIGVNVSSNNMVHLTQLIDAVGDRLEIHVGGPLHAMTALAMGANGFLSADANIAPKLAGSIIDRWRTGDFPRAFEAYHRIMRLFASNQFGPSARFVKAAFQLLGLPGGHLRDPHLPITEAERRGLASRLKLLDIARIEGLA